MLKLTNERKNIRCSCKLFQGYVIVRRASSGLFFKFRNGHNLEKTITSVFSKFSSEFPG